MFLTTCDAILTEDRVGYYLGLLLKIRVLTASSHKNEAFVRAFTCLTVPSGVSRTARAFVASRLVGARSTVLTRITDSTFVYVYKECKKMEIEKIYLFLFPFETERSRFNNIFNKNCCSP